jgi:uncharacterized membrane protein
MKSISDNHNHNNNLATTISICFWCGITSVVCVMIIAMILTHTYSVLPGFGFWIMLVVIAGTIAVALSAGLSVATRASRWRRGKDGRDRGC